MIGVFRVEEYPATDAHPLLVVNDRAQHIESPLVVGAHAWSSLYDDGFGAVFTRILDHRDVPAGHVVAGAVAVGGFGTRFRGCSQITFHAHRNALIVCNRSRIVG